ncbi:hypothetical protein [Massilia consociata]|uniref:Lipoprotein n=1 Tax=Massilia consociata TaxID=760117 RepID=A0ABV6FK52_9BURK
MRGFVSILALAAACTAAPSAACPQKVPAGLAPTVVGEGVRVDGLTLSILQVRGAEPGEAVLDRVEQAWRAEGYRVKRNRAAGWNIVSALGERCLSTLQLAERGSAEGFFAVNPLTRARAGTPPAPPGARLLSAVSSKEDDGRRGTMAALVSQQPVDALREYYMQRLRRDRWESVRADARGSAEGRSDSVVVSAQRGRERIEVVLWRDIESHIVVNQAEAL